MISPDSSPQPLMRRIRRDVREGFQDATVITSLSCVTDAIFSSRGEPIRRDVHLRMVHIQF
jgi:hypothetical protein